MTLLFLQQYWWLLVSLLGALLVFMFFVQGGNSLIFSLGVTDDERRMLINSTGRKWELTFTTLVTFGGAAFAAFPLFYSTSFGGAYWLWMLILLTFVVQAVSYEFQHKQGNLLGARPFQFCLQLNGILGPLLIGGAVATFFEGSNFIVAKENLTGMGNPVISSWANASHGLDALLCPWVLVLGFAVVFLARILGILYFMNNVDDENIRSRGSVRLVGQTVPFLILFVAYLVHVLLKDGYAYDPATGVISVEPLKYLHNLLALWPLAIVLLVGIAFVLYGIVRTIRSKTYIGGIWPVGVGTILTVLILLLLAGWNNTAFYPSTADLQSSLTIENASSSMFTLRTMAYVSLLIPFVLGYIAYVWRAMDRKKIDKEEIAESGHTY
ncbi:MAG: cytochrome d ubiquinol oxidase subunit II [Bacteroidaceae bacterium]|nr:cytochrome d ubiquinol oxidase subunit II [Bacteroidaceae bacterium]MBP3830718.1 cytochrome d ubiquinol oxidase subunit II [Bacteroidaceae bacterium]